MIKITNSEREALENVGLLRHKRTGYNSCDPSFYVANKEHTGRNKHTYIVEDPDVMKFLGYYENQNLQKINEKQYELLVENGLINEANTQKWGKYNPKAICYENQFGEYRIAKIASLMLFLGLWKDNKRKRMAKMQSREQAMAESNANEVDPGGNEPDGLNNPVKTSNGMPDIMEQAKALGMPKVIFRDADTGEIVKAGGLELLSGYGINVDQLNN